MNKRFLILIISSLLSVSVFAAGSKVDPSPMDMVKKTSSQMLRELDKHLGRLKNNDKLVYSLVNRILVPHFDRLHMAKAVVGRNYWKKASSNVRRDFLAEFTKYIIRTYSAALQSYDGETMKFYPIRGAIGKRVRISSDLLLKSGPPIQLQYGVWYRDGKWLIYDFSVDGISIIKNYKSQFAGVLRQKGLSGLLRELKQRNKRA